ncbi:putative hydroxymethylpyrimidine transporter CytX [Thermosinus carboxydivorans Nor1]|uniref:Putative hydroxymethylpyrimidine transporter CytX n=1 Tax=Thermosinus carboxydivorans Nor1 TaxID=401526 RepID=A1HPK9_9FIRM|nr:putative hydroxymethylpyrimidine transporter CytX [Thermosinus carboxydivorans]EAX47981.1 putative hydroxymethylpyrimidine transporter CytX [Thermosinus carboxydivorans Nor1]
MNESNTLKFRHYLLLWFGAAVSVAEILAGGLLVPLGFTTGSTAILLGHLIGTTLLVMGGIIGTRERIPAIESTRISFGAYGSLLFAGLNVLQLIGWTAIMIISAAKSANEITKMLWQFDQLTLWCLVIGGLIFLWIVLGREGGWKLINMAAVLLLFGLTIMLSAMVFKDTNVFAKAPAGGMLFSEGVELSVVMPLSWLPLIADYTRFADNAKKAAWGSWLGYFFGSCWMYLIGLAAAISTGKADPADIMLAANLGLAALGIIVLSTVTTTFMDAYSAGVSFINFRPGLNEKLVALVVTVVGTLLALVADIEQYEAFLLTIGSVFAPLFAIVLTDYFILKNRVINPQLLVNWGALTVWAVGVALYYWFLKLDLVLGATIPVMIVTGLLYRVASRYIDKWVYCKKAPNPCCG